MLFETAKAIAVPGWGAHERRRSLAVALALAGVVAPSILVAYVAASGRRWVALSLDASFLGWFVGVLALALIARVVAVIEAWWAAGRRPAANWRDVLAVALAMIVTVPTAVAIVQVGRARASIAPAFENTPDGPLYDASRPADEAADPVTAGRATPGGVGAADGAEVTDGGSGRIVRDPDVVVTTTATTTTLPPEPPPPPDSGVDPALLADVWTVLLIGGDSGPDRFGLRTDTMMLFSLHVPSGRAGLVSIPRDMKRLLFPPASAMGQRYPWGFDDIANAVYPYVSSRNSLRSAYALDGVRPGVLALAQGIGYSLDVTIDDYVLVDMQGFLELVDAVGGVTVDVTREIPMPGNVPGAPTQYPDTIGPGVIHMDGTTALGYVRSRYADNDFRRTSRQRKLLAALAAQVSLEDVALSFPSVSAALGGTLRTSLTPDELAEVLLVIGGETAIVESVGLVPPLASISRPDFDRMARIVGEIHLALVGGYRSGY